MSLCSRQPLRVTGEVSEWTWGRRSNYVYFCRTLEAATWGGGTGPGRGPGRIYEVEPTGPIEEDPNLTNRKFRGNPTQSYRSRHPLKVTGEVVGWRGHGPEAVAAMKEGLERLAQSGAAHIDD